MACGKVQRKGSGLWMLEDFAAQNVRQPIGGLAVGIRQALGDLASQRLVFLVPASL